MFTDEELLMAFNNSWEDDVDLRTLEISFDRTCNFACSYCSPSYSTTWASDIKNKGPYERLDTDDRNHYTNDHAWAQPFNKEENPYVEAFWEWWPELSNYLTELRVTGGEPLLSKDLWKLIDMIIETKPNLDFALNSNLVNSEELINKLVTVSHKFKNFKLYTSCESFGNHAEYIRDGLKWDIWSNNLRKAAVDGNFRSITIMMTLNALCLYSMIEFCDFIINLRKETGKHIDLSFNVMRYPAFQSIEVLPKTVRHEFYEKINLWFQQRIHHLYTHEIEQVERFLLYLKEGTSHVNFTQEELLRNFKDFYSQYDERRGKDLLSTFPEIEQWI
jgi:organic radical activating enzyme